MAVCEYVYCSMDSWKVTCIAVVRRRLRQNVLTERHMGCTDHNNITYIMKRLVSFLYVEFWLY